MACKKLYEVRVTRSYQEEFVDIVVRASSAGKAEKIAEREAGAKADQWFGTPSPIIEATDAEALDFDPDCEVVE